MKAARNGSRADSGRTFEADGEKQSSQPPASFGGIAGGADQAGVRVYNERLLLTLVRRFGPFVENRGSETDGIIGAIDLGDHEPAPGGRAPEARGPAARTGRTTDRSNVARSRGRLFARPQDRPAQLRPRVDRFSGRRPAPRPPHLRLSHPGDGPRFRPLLPAPAGGWAERRAKAADRRAWRRCAVPPVDLGGGNRRPAGAMARGATSTSNGKSPSSVPTPSCCATTRRRPAPPSFSSDRAGDTAISYISSSARSSAAGWCSMARCGWGGRATPARSDRCR